MVTQLKKIHPDAPKLEQEHIEKALETVKQKEASNAVTFFMSSMGLAAIRVEPFVAIVFVTVGVLNALTDGGVHKRRLEKIASESESVKKALKEAGMH